MTVKELYEWAVKHKAENYDIVDKNSVGDRQLTMDVEHDAEIDHQHHYIEL